MSILNLAYGENTPILLPYLCFTAESANSTIQLVKGGNPTVVTLETSTDGTTWSTYTFGSTITLSNIGDKVYWRNTSETTTGFSTDTSNRYSFVISGKIAGSGDITTLINKNGTDTLISDYCFTYLFSGYNLTTAPELPATTLTQYCYYNMFYECTQLVSHGHLPATVLPNNCYRSMFDGCSNLSTIAELPVTTFGTYSCRYMYRYCTKIKISTTTDANYPTPYKIPNGTDTSGNALNNMFTNTGGTFTGTPDINTTYYTSNTVV